MPQGANTSKSKNSKKARPPAHQNTFAFKHNPKSKLTEKILSSPIQHCCRRCTDKLEWRKQYRKYKPLTQMAKCNLCSQKNIKSAYHTICDKCTTSDKAKKNLIDAKLKEADLSAADTAAATAIAAASLIAEETSTDPQAAAEPLLSMDAIHRVCAMCAKEVALPDEDQAPETVDEILAREQRRVSLRERKTMERKLEKDNVDERKVAKAERRRLRLLERLGNGGDDDNSDNDDDAESENSEHVDDAIPEEDSDEEDPFLKAVGGADKLLTGEAYQHMLLAKERGRQGA
jgi:predicted nucleic acid-binding Zn ribbon protein